MPTHSRRHCTSLVLLFSAAVLVLSALPSFAQGTASSSVVVGQNARGEDIVVRVIPLKFLDPVEAADLLAALGFPGTIIPVNPPHRPGEAFGAQQGYGGRTGGTRPGGSQYGRGYEGPAYEGYGGYGQAGERSRQNPGYQSPYGNR